MQDQITACKQKQREHSLLFSLVRGSIGSTVCGIRQYYLSHAIDNTANQRAWNPLLVLRYPVGSISHKTPAIINQEQRKQTVQQCCEDQDGSTFQTTSLTEIRSETFSSCLAIYFWMPVK